MPHFPFWIVNKLCLLQLPAAVPLLSCFLFLRRDARALGSTRLGQPRERQNLVVLLPRKTPVNRTSFNANVIFLWKIDKYFANHYLFILIEQDKQE